ncbi:MAG TPA: hypothetical protein VG273_07350, partial [Bryobacteraceae bacterium]|nr:hypothetical protein [Bryobacteraceae bacterium]
MLRTIISGLLLCPALFATITKVQQVSGSAQSGGNLCPGTGTSCGVTVAATRAGHVLVAVFELQSSGSSTVTAVTGGGTWVHAPNCIASDPSGIKIDCWYVLNSTAGATTITGTITSGSGRGVDFYELSAAAGCTMVFDGSGSADISSTVTSQPGVALTLGGFNDAIIEGIYANAAVTAVGGGYTLSSIGGAQNRHTALLLNTSSGAAPGWTVGTRVGAVTNAIAISESCPVSLVTVSPGPVTKSATENQQFSANVTGLSTTGVNTAVTWTINPPGAGSITSNGHYTAPAAIAVAQNVTVKAASVADPTFFGTATVSLVPTSALPGGTFSLNELFGVPWPEQPIEFRYDGGQPPPSTRMLGPLGTEVPYQWVSGPSCSDPTAVNGCIVVRSNLPANASYTWILQSGVLPTATVTNPVQINQVVSLLPVGTNYELTNGLTGVRIASLNLLLNLAPIQGIQLRDGTWTGAGLTPNILYREAASGSGGQAAGCVGCLLRTALYQATGYTVTVVDSGPLKTVVKVNYTFNRPQYQYGSAPNTVVINTAGTGHYTMLVTLYANSKSVLIDEDTDMQLSWYLPINAQVRPDTARWRGHDSIDINGNPNPACGYEQILTVTAASATSPIVITTSASGGLTNGQAVQVAGVGGIAAANGTYYAKTTGFSGTQFALYTDVNLTRPVSGTGAFSGGGRVKPAYRGQNLNTVSDALQDLTYTADRPASYLCSAGNSPSYEKLLTAYPAATHSAGWYVEMYNSTAGAAAPVVGFYIGRGSKQVYSAIGPSQPGIYTSNNHWITGAPAAGIQADTLLRGPDGSTICGTAPLPCNGVVHRNWGIFVSTEADLLPTGAHQPIADEQNELTGINLSRLYTYQLVYNDPPGGWQPLYLSAAAAAQIQSWVQNGTAVCGSPACYATLLSNSDGSPAARALVAMWQGNSAAAVQTALAAPTNLAVQLVSALASGDNRFDRTLGYYGLGLQSSPQTVV